MKKPELLSPVGDFKSLQMAIDGGADAVYLSLKKYGARAFALNFTQDEVKEAIRTCHLYGVKIYVAMNTLVKDSEVEDFLDNIEFLYLNDVDAVIIQDFGMMCLIREKYPDLEIHASTQFNNCNINTLSLLKKMGVKRAVLARELTLDEIKNIKIDIEKEVFIHGALCISYSGCCLFSSMIGNRSGNRGECSGCCRLPYKLVKDRQIIDEGYLLSTKELNTTRKIKELLESGIDSLKIEGRMKSSLYVYFVTRFYRNLIDNFDEVDIKQEEDKLKIIYNRMFTEGHLFNVNNRDILNTKSPNHVGKEIGKVIELKKDKIKIKLDYSLHQEDGIRFLDSKKGMIVNFLYDENMKLKSSCTDICYIDNKVGLKKLDKVYLTSSKYLEKEVLNYEPRKIEITFTVKAYKNGRLVTTVSDGVNNITREDFVVEKSKTIQTDKERIISQLLKVGGTIYKVKKVEVSCEQGIFIPIKTLNEIRREILEELNDRRCIRKKGRIEKVKFNKLDIIPTSFNTITVKREKELLDFVDKYDRIYVLDKELFLKYKDKYSSIYYSGKRNQYNLELLERNLIHEICEVKNNSISDYTCNCYNRYTVYYLHKLGYETVTLSVELNKEEIKELQDRFYKEFKFRPNIEVIEKGYIELMIIKGDIFKEHSNVKLVDYKDKEYKILYNDGFTHIYKYIIFDKDNSYKKLVNINIRNEAIV